MSKPDSADHDALVAERERVIDMEPAGPLAALRQGEYIAELSRRINAKAGQPSADAADGDQPYCTEHGGYICTHLPRPIASAENRP